MDPVTQNVYQNIDEYLKSLVAECLQAPGVVNLPQDQKNAFAEQVRDYLSQASLEVLVDKLSGEQFSQIENLEPGSQEMVEKIQVLAAQVPGLVEVLEARFKKDVDYIKQNSKIPEQSSLEGG